MSGSAEPADTAPPEETGTRPSGRRAARLLPAGRRARAVLVAVLTVVVTAGIGLGVAFAFPTQYAARAQLVYLLGDEQPTGFLREDRNLSTQVQLLRSRAVLEPVARKHGLTDKDLGRKLHIDLVSGTEVMNLRLDDPSRRAGRTVLQEVLDQYMTVADHVAPSTLRTYLNKQLADVRDQMQKPGLSGSERQTLLERQMTLLDRLDSVNLAGAQVKVVVPPYSDPDAVSPRPLFGLVTGALVGMLAVGCLTLWQARRWARE
ncbi:hypothetical protein AB0H97_28860 [Streptomyces sp. NPDC050788]|jgi:uncharacterized protein involved in exopolysaccharide biosynthesis|uniref:hypothetical protein n=1 Tax=Streptomyces sp. NPDC050788 TaxID=3155041 RepID=UPI003421211A